MAWRIYYTLENAAIEISKALSDDYTAADLLHLGKMRVATIYSRLNTSDFPHLSFALNTLDNNLCIASIPAANDFVAMKINEEACAIFENFPEDVAETISTENVRHSCGENILVFLKDDEIPVGKIYILSSYTENSHKVRLQFNDIGEVVDYLLMHDNTWLSITRESLIMYRDDLLHLIHFIKNQQEEECLADYGQSLRGEDLLLSRSVFQKTALQENFYDMLDRVTSKPNESSHNEVRLSSKTSNKQVEVIAGLAAIYTNSDCSKPYEAANTIVRDWQIKTETLGLGVPPNPETLVKYIRAGIERIKP